LGLVYLKVDYPIDLILDYSLMKAIKESVTWGVTVTGRRRRRGELHLEGRCLYPLDRLRGRHHTTYDFHTTHDNISLCKIGFLSLLRLLHISNMLIYVFQDGSGSQ
jgi:hypothetical protein